jgi:hypothetical protein
MLTWLLIERYNLSHFFLATFLLDPSGRQSRMIIITAATHSIIQLATALLGELLALVELPSAVEGLSIAELVPMVEMFAMAWLLVITYTWRDSRDQLDCSYVSSQLFHNHQL